MEYSLNTPAGRARFARQLYNFCHILETDEEASDTDWKVAQLKEAIKHHDEKFPMDSFFYEGQSG